MVPVQASVLAEPRRTPQGTAWVIVSRVPLEVKHMSLLTVFSIARGITVTMCSSWGHLQCRWSSCKQQRPEVRRKAKETIFSLSLPLTSPWIPNHKHISWQLAFGKASKGVFHTPPVFVEGVALSTCKALNSSQGPPGSMLRTFKHGCQPLLLNQYPRGKSKYLLTLGRTLYICTMTTISLTGIVIK